MFLFEPDELHHCHNGYRYKAVNYRTPKHVLIGSSGERL